MDIADVKGNIPAVAVLEEIVFDIAVSWEKMLNSVLLEAMWLDTAAAVDEVPVKAELDDAAGKQMT